MAKNKKYQARGDTGRDHVFFEFYSEHRAESKANYEDARKEYKLRHGHSIKILNTARLYD